MQIKVNKSILKVGKKNYNYYSLNEIGKVLNRDVSRLPVSLKILLENMVRNSHCNESEPRHMEALVDSVKDASKRIEISFCPTRVLMQDFTGVPAVVDLATMRDAVKKAGGDPQSINPLIPVDLVIDHSVQVDYFGTKSAFGKNVKTEMERNFERYQFLKWAQKSFNNFQLVPPGTGICHQVNLEHLAKVIWGAEKSKGEFWAYPDTVIGTDSHTTMVNGMCVLGWGVGGIEAEAAMLGQPVSMLIPEVIGVRLTGKLKEGVTATSLVLTLTEMLRKKGVVGKFVEFFGPAVKSLTLSARATIANMAPEYGATCGIFPIDQQTLDYLKLTGRSEESIKRVEAYAKKQGMFAGKTAPEFSEVVDFDISKVEPSMAGPKRPQDRVSLSKINESFAKLIAETKAASKITTSETAKKGIVKDGDVVIAAITSCTNTSNPRVMVAAGLVAKKAAALGLKSKPYVKTSIAPGSHVVGEYLAKSGLQKSLDKIGFNLVGYGCTTCIGNSGPLDPKIEKEIKEKDLTVASVLSGNRNFESRIHLLVRGNYLASPPMVVVYALAGTMNIDLTKDPIGEVKGKKIYLKDIWPKDSELETVIKKYLNRAVFIKKYADVFKGNKEWQKIKVTKSGTYDWENKSTYIRTPEFFKGLGENNVKDIKSAKILMILGDSITTDHISPAGNISSSSPAAKYLSAQGVKPEDFNTYGARRGNHEVMMRGTFANTMIKNEILKTAEGKISKEGGYTKMSGASEVISVFDAAMEYQKQGTGLVIFAGKEYGTGSSRDWAAKGPFLLGIKAVIAESFERIHRSNLIGMGIIPLIFKPGENRKTLKLIGNETIDILGIGASELSPRQEVKCIITRADSSKDTITLISQLDTKNEIEYYKSGGILRYVINNLNNAH